MARRDGSVKVAARGILAGILVLVSGFATGCESGGQAASQASAAAGPLTSVFSGSQARTPSSGTGSSSPILGSAFYREDAPAPVGRPGSPLEGMPILGIR